jgi:putative nucleotidyltransferase with HDIG domain
MIPSIETCFHLMDTYHMLDNIKAHSIVVAKVTHLISRGLRDAELPISVEMATAGALMHDIGKTACLKSRKDHSKMGIQICLQNHLDEIVDIVGEHVRLKNNSLNSNYSEKEIVYYADKRVKHTAIVTLEERLAYIIGRYGRNEKKIFRVIKTNFDFCKKVERKLFGKLNFSPESLSQLARDENIGEISQERTGPISVGTPATAEKK